MHAALVMVTIDQVQAPAAAVALMDDIMPRITSAPGFAAGYWLEPADGRGFSILLFNTEDQARQAAQATSSWSAPGVTIDAVEVRPVAVSVPSIRHPASPGRAREAGLAVSDRGRISAEIMRRQHEAAHCGA
ncbi:MAG TPA: hypothetical protein VIV12_02680 [Streptosporangiaceae bacterium]